MIQRIQSLLLLLAAVCYIWAAFLPIAVIHPKDDGEADWIRVEEPTEEAATGGVYTYTAWKVSDSQGETIAKTTLVAVLELLLGLCSLVVIFLFKKRKLQSKLCLANMFFGLLLLALMLFIYPDMLLPKQVAMKGAEVVYSLWTMVPMLAILLEYVAQKFILKDEKLVRASDRLR